MLWSADNAPLPHITQNTVVSSLTLTNTLQPTAPHEALGPWDPWGAQVLCRLSGNNKRAGVVVFKLPRITRNETKNTGLIGVSGKADTSPMHNKCVAKPHIPNAQWGHHPKVWSPICDATAEHLAYPSMGVGCKIRKNQITCCWTKPLKRVSLCRHCFFFHIQSTSLYHNENGDIHNRTIPTQMSLQAGDKDVSYKTFQCTPSWWHPVSRVSRSSAPLSASQSSLQTLTPHPP